LQKAQTLVDIIPDYLITYFENKCVLRQRYQKQLSLKDSVSGISIGRKVFSTSLRKSFSINISLQLSDRYGAKHVDMDRLGANALVEALMNYKKRQLGYADCN
jgi:hypothetical protein